MALYPFEETVLLLMEQLGFGYSEVMQMGVRKIAVYVSKAIEKAEQEEAALRARQRV